MKLPVNILSLLLPLLCLISCSTNLEKIPSSEFAPKPLTKWEKPFDGVWADDKLKEEDVLGKKIYIAPVDLSYIQPPFADEDQKTAAERLGRYFDSELEKKINQNPTASSRVTTSQKQADYLLETAFIEIRRTFYGLHFVSLGTSYFIPGINYLLNPFSKGHMILMIRFKNAKNGKTALVFGDYKSDEPSLFGSVRDYTPYGHHYQTIDLWTDEISEVLGLQSGQVVEKPLWITVNPF